MLKKAASILCICIMLTGCAMGSKHETKLADATDLGKNEPVIVRTESYEKWKRDKLSEFPTADNFTCDVRSYNLSKFNLETQKDSLQYVTFDTDTIWPEKLPNEFDPKQILETGKNPGLGIRALHEQGITGKGVNIAIIDQGLLVEHDEYKDNIMLYELLHCSDNGAQMHGPAVTSIAVGKNTGVAPEANVYYIASTFGTFTSSGFEEDLTHMADSIRRILQINESLPENEKIRVISISKGFDYRVKGSNDVLEAIETAKEAGVFVITASTQANYDFSLMGMGREMNDNPDDVSSYLPGLFYADDYYSGNVPIDKLMLAPMDSRSYASFTGVSDYAFGSAGGLSWTCPWLAGLYALCIQVKPDITPDEFINLAHETGDIIDIQHNGEDFKFGTIINPINIINELKK